MPRPLGFGGADGLPVWDTLEAVYFLVAGLSAGLVLGFLFPSMWRSFRRRFRNTRRFGVSSFENDVRPPLRVLSDYSDDPSETPEQLGSTGVEVDALFVQARGLVHAGRVRDAVQVYVSILGDERVTKRETNRALFELAQCYELMGLSGRAFDMAVELLSRKPKLKPVLEFILDLLVTTHRYERIDEILVRWKGDSDARLRVRISHSLCEHGEILLRSGRLNEAREYGIRAIRWSLVCARARILVWQATSEETLQRIGNDVGKLWIALAVDIEARVKIFSDTGVSHAAGSEYLRSLLAFVSKIDSFLDGFPAVEKEFRAVSKLDLSEKGSAIVVDELLFHAIISELRGWSSDAADRFLPAVGVISPHLLARIAQVSRALGPSVAELLQRNTRVHKCKTCGAAALAFAWRCPHCGERESLMSQGAGFLSSSNTQV